MIIQRKRGFEVTPRSGAEIEKLAEKVRLFAADDKVYNYLLFHAVILLSEVQIIPAY